MSEIETPAPPVAFVDALADEARAIAAENPPSRVLAKIVLSLLAAVGFLIGRAYLAVAATVAFCGLAVKYGYRKGVKAQTAAPKKRPAAPEAQQEPQGFNYAHRG